MTSSAPPSCRPTARPRLPTSRRRPPGRAAWRGGATIVEGVTVTGIEVEGGVARAVLTDRGRVGAEAIVICAGQWSREVGRMAGVNVPLVSMQHQYLITEPIEGVGRGLPT